MREEIIDRDFIAGREFRGKILMFVGWFLFAVLTFVLIYACAAVTVR